MKKVLALLSLTLLACEKEVDLIIPEPESKIVMDAKIFTGDSVLVQLSTSEYYLRGEGYNYNLDSNYSVMLYEDGTHIENLSPKNGSSGLYFSSKSVPQVDKSYEIKVVREGYETVSGSVQTKKAIDVQKLRWDTTASGAVVMSFNFNDPEKTNDTYLIRATADVGETPPYYVFFTSFDPFIENFEKTQRILDINQYEQTGRYFLISDKNLTRVSKEVTLELFRFQSDSWPSDINSINLFFYRVSDDYYQYQESKFNHYQTSLGIFSEPVRVYSNVDKGFGNIASLTKTKVSLSF